MVYNGKHYQIDDLGVPLFLETPIWLDEFTRCERGLRQAPMSNPLNVEYWHVFFSYKDVQGIYAGQIVCIYIYT